MASARGTAAKEQSGETSIVVDPVYMTATVTEYLPALQKESGFGGALCSEARRTLMLLSRYTKRGGPAERAAEYLAAIE